MLPILIVDDEPAIAALISRVLTAAGYTCQAVTSSEKAADLIQQNRYDLVLLDVMMPKIDGYDLLEYIRPTGTPSIFVTAKDAVSERVRGLHSGADDYIVKPFAPAELTARVEAVLRRTGRATVQYSLWGCTVDTAACRVTRAGQEIKLTRKEYELLLLLLRGRGTALYRDYLYETLWGDDMSLDTRTLDTHITRLRKKLDLGDKLHAVRQVGYMLEKE
ncbi:MAG: response regulator transcription factor [Subdoligranulum sp.]|nr:response regulator transcription factor [Subdoligranulum sp.]MDD7266287.1 response regulator transcription factor [Subdoligranulum sp.]